MVLLGMAVVTYIPRVAPLWVLASRSLPSLVVDWLRFVPVAVLAAMLAPSLLLLEGRATMGAENLFFWAGLPTFLVAIRTRSLFASVLTGMILGAAARLIVAS